MTPKGIMTSPHFSCWNSNHHLLSDKATSSWLKGIDTPNSFLCEYLRCPGGWRMGDSYMSSDSEVELCSKHCGCRPTRSTWCMCRAAQGQLSNTNTCELRCRYFTRLEVQMFIVYAKVNGSKRKPGWETLWPQFWGPLHGMICQNDATLVGLTGVVCSGTWFKQTSWSFLTVVVESLHLRNSIPILVMSPALVARHVTYCNIIFFGSSIPTVKGCPQFLTVPAWRSLVNIHIIHSGFWLVLMNYTSGSLKMNWHHHPG